MDRGASSSPRIARHWDIWSGALLVAVLFFGQVVFVSIALPILALVSGLDPNKLADQQAGSTPLVLGGTAYLFAGATALELARHLAHRRGWPSLREALALYPSRLWIAGVLLALLTAVVSDGFTLLAGRPIVPPEFRPIFADPLTGVTFALFAVLVPPVVEESIFRGVLLPALERTYGRFWAIALSAVAFGLVHSSTYGLDWHPIVLSSVTGLLLGALRVYSGSLWPAIAGHSAMNLYASLEALFLPVLLGYWP